jgi:kynurenine 3-monooxygenase
LSRSISNFNSTPPWLKRRPYTSMAVSFWACVFISYLFLVNKMNTLMKEENICIVGAGLTGCLMALYLGQRGYKVHVFEKRPDIRFQNGESSKRSIAMSLSDRGWKALYEVGLGKEVEAGAIPKFGRASHARDGSVTVHPYGKESQSIFAIRRLDLNKLLLSAAEKLGNVKIHFDTKLQTINELASEAVFINLKDSRVTNHRFTRLIGADGAFSKVREWMESQGATSVQIDSSEYSFIETKVPLVRNLYDPQWQNDYLHFWSSDGSLIISQTCVEDTFTSTFLNHQTGEDSFEELDTEEKVREFFSRAYPSISEHHEELIEDYYGSPVNKITTVKCSDWTYKNNILLLGDACHAMTPFYGMGMNVCFEDCSSFNNLLERMDDHWGRAMSVYSVERKKETDAISDMAYNHRNGIFNRSNQNFAKKWKLERMIWSAYPDLLLPEYTLVAFSHMPFSEVQELCKMQDDILNDILGESGDEIFHNAPAFHKIVKRESARLMETWRSTEILQ